MSKSIKILLFTTLTIVVAVGVFVLSTGKKQEEEITIGDYSNIYNNIKIETELKSVQFETLEEMMEYSDMINKINGLEEATDFITKYYEACEKNNIELMLTFYDENTWDFILSKEAFPCYDASAQCEFKIENINVKEGKKDNEFIATYQLVIIDSESGKKIGALEREDTLELSKMFETIKIERYVRETKKQNILLGGNNE